MSDDPEIVDAQDAPAVPAINAPSRVVGIGASAGGLEAFSELLRHLPKNTGMSFVFVQHLEPKQTSRLTEILSRITEMPVEVATDGVAMQRDRVYVMPPGLDLTLSDGILKLEPRTDTAGRHLPIDNFFRSLAKGQGSKAVAVILSGMGSDGAAGLKVVKESGGTTFAQDETSAQHSSMPAAAIGSGFVDILFAGQQCALLMVQDLTDLQRLKQDVIDISEGEQRRFSRDLHDSHCQDLTAIAFFAETIAAALDTKDADNAAQVRLLGEMVRKSAENVHMLAASLSSQQIEQSGLADALKELASHTSQRFKVACTAKTDRKKTIRNNELALHLYRIAQEATSNAARHSRAKRIDIELRLEGDRGVLEIEDDGDGFSVKRKTTGLGLRTMEYRAAVIKGTLKIDSKLGTGTVVTCSFPTSAAK